MDHESGTVLVRLIYLGDLNDKLKGPELTYSLLIDACYEGEAEDDLATTANST